MTVSYMTLRFLRDHKLDPEVNFRDRGVAIHEAIFAKRADVVEDLLDLYPKDCINARDQKGFKRGRTPLHNAAQIGHRQILLKLLEKGAEVDARTKKKWTALILAAEAGQAEIINILIKHGADFNAQTQFEGANTKGYTSLHVAAAEMRSPSTILTLLLHGANTEMATSTGETPLHFAVQTRSAFAASLLLFHGASATAIDEKGATPRNLVNAMRGVERRTFEHLFDCASSKGNHNTLIQEYLKPGTTLNMAKAIIWAVGKNLERGVAYVLHADPHAVEARDSRRWFPLHCAASFGKTECAKVLLQHGANPNCLTKTGWTPLMLASERGHMGAIQDLLDHKANRDTENDDKKTALQIARNCNQRVAAMLLTVRHVAPSNAVLDMSPDDDTDALLPPKNPNFRRTPSPGPQRVPEIEGELLLQHYPNRTKRNS